MNEYEYTGNKTRNYFTAYLQKCIRWKRKNDLQKKEKIRDMEEHLEDDLQMEYGMNVEEMAEVSYKEKLLLRECDRDYPE